MLHSLVMRQLFVMAEWVLVLLLIVGGTFLSLRIMSGSAPNTEAGVIGALGDFDGGETLLLASVKSRADYASIIGSGLFGAAGRREVVAATAEAPSAEPVKITELRLKLCGTAATHPKDIYASAVILNEDNNTVRSYGIGDAVVEAVTLEEIHQRKVILFNKAKNEREELRAEDYEDDLLAAAAPASGAPAAPASAENVTLKKAELVQELFTNYAEIASQVKPELYTDESGNIAGITASNIESIPMAQKLGVRDGDVLQSVNNEPIDSEQKIYELINKYRNATSIRVGILRNGRPVTVTYNLD